MNIGFVGLGIMGSPMAANLLKAGYVVTGYDVSAARVEQLAELGGKPATGVVDAVAGADVVITMLPDSPRSRKWPRSSSSTGNRTCSTST